MAEIPDRIPGEIIFASYSNDIRDRTVQRYVDATARDAGNPVPNAGDLAYLTASSVVQFFDGTQWINFTTGGAVIQGGLLLAADQAVSNTAPASNNTLASVQLTIPAVTPVIVDAVGMVSAGAVDENQGFEAFIRIDGADQSKAGVTIGTVSQGGHTHSSQGSTTTGTASSHIHTIAVGLHNHGSSAPSISVANAVKTISPIGLREFTPASTTISVNLVGNNLLGSPGSFLNRLIAKVYSA